jgi:actin-related protein 6
MDGYHSAWNMMDETHTMTDVKHKLCYVALDFLSELEATKKANAATRREFVMPNWTTRMEGYVKPGEEW